MYVQTPTVNEVKRHCNLDWIRVVAVFLLVVKLLFRRAPHAYTNEECE